MPGKVNYRANIWALKEAGCTHIIATTATGSLQEHIRPGELVLLDSFIDRWELLNIYFQKMYIIVIHNSTHISLYKK